MKLANVIETHEHTGARNYRKGNNETLSVVAMRVCNPDRSPLRING
jgi:hypothetical protein